MLKENISELSKTTESYKTIMKKCKVVSYNKYSGVLVFFYNGKEIQTTIPGFNGEYVNVTPDDSKIGFKITA